MAEDREKKKEQNVEPLLDEYFYAIIGLKQAKFKNGNPKRLMMLFVRESRNLNYLPVCQFHFFPSYLLVNQQEKRENNEKKCSVHDHHLVCQESIYGVSVCRTVMECTHTHTKNTN